MARKAAVTERRARDARLGFRVDGSTKQLVQRAASLERRSLTDFCLTAVARAAQEVIVRHETLVLSERDRRSFFKAITNPPRPHARLKRGFKAEQERIAP